MSHRSHKIGDKNQLQEGVVEKGKAQPLSLIRHDGGGTIRHDGGGTIIHHDGGGSVNDAVGDTKV